MGFLQESLFFLLYKVCPTGDAFHNQPSHSGTDSVGSPDGKFTNTIGKKSLGAAGISHHPFSSSTLITSIFFAYFPYT